MENTVIEKTVAQKKLVYVWVTGGLLTIVVFIMVSLSRTDDKSFNEALQWLFNYISPGMTLIIGAFAYAANQQDTPKKLINISFYKVTLWFTILYLLTILIITLLTPFLQGEDTLLIDYFKKFNLIISFLQTSLLVLLGIFFTKENKG